MKAKIANSAEICKKRDGTVVTTINNNPVTGRASCELDTDSDGDIDYHWGSYQKCYGNVSSNIPYPGLTKTPAKR